MCSCRVAFAWARILSIVVFMSLRTVSRGACLGGVRYVYWGGVSGASLGAVIVRPFWGVWVWGRGSIGGRVIRGLEGL